MPSRDSHAILTTRTKMNPANPVGADFFSREQTAYVLRNAAGTVIVATSFGDLAFKTGEWREFHHDQSRRSMGELEVIGVADFTTGETLGEVPDQPVTHYVFK